MTYDNQLPFFAKHSLQPKYLETPDTLAYSTQFF